MLAFVQEALDSSLKNPEDAELLIAAPALASIPAEAQTRAARLLTANGSKRLKGNDHGRTGIALLQGTTSGLSEAYRALRTSVLLSSAVRAPHTILITSASAGEGKTNTAINLALALAQCGSFRSAGGLRSAPALHLPFARRSQPARHEHVSHRQQQD